MRNIIHCQISFRFLKLLVGVILLVGVLINLDYAYNNYEVVHADDIDATYFIPPLCQGLGNSPDLLIKNYNFIAERLSLPEDLAGNGIPDVYALELVRQLGCADEYSALWGATLNAFEINYLTLQYEADADTLTDYHVILAVLLLLDEDTQYALIEHLAEQNIYLTGDYAVVQCLSIDNCAPAMDGEHPLWEQYLIYPPEAEGLYTPYSASGEVISDGISNVERLDNDIEFKTPDIEDDVSSSTIKSGKQSVIGISTIEELQKIGNDPDYPLDGHYELTNDIDASDTMNWNDGAGFEPIGTGEKTPEETFTGNFNGNGHIITDLTINRADSSYIGLFGETGIDAEIQYVNLHNVNITGKNCVGGLIGKNKGKVNTAHVWGRINGRTGVGGIAGYNRMGILNVCNAEVHIKGYIYVGGLTGYNNIGEIVSGHTSGSIEGFSSVGGLVGSTDSNSDWINHTSYNKSGYYDSDFIEHKDSQQENSISYSSSKAWVSGNHRVGGLAGQTIHTKMSNSYSESMVMGTLQAGGLIGMSWFSDIEDCFSMGLVRGTNHVGGLIGYATTSSAARCFAIATIKGHEIVGGLLGRAHKLDLSDSFFTGTITAHELVGGLVATLDSSSISSSYSSGKIFGTENTGGAVSYRYLSYVDNTFWDVDKSSITHSSGGTGMSSNQLQSAITFIDAGWDFDTVWGIDEGIGTPYHLSLQHFYDRKTDSVISISSIEELQCIGNDPDYPLDGHYVLTQDIDASETIYWNDGKGFDPIGKYGPHGGRDLAFSSYLDGQGYQINGLHINRPEENFVGLFGYVVFGAMIFDIGIVDSSVVGNEKVGTLVGQNRGLISGCHAIGDVVGYDWHVGGLAGEVHFGTVENSYSVCNVSGKKFRAGGLIGLNYNGTINDSFSLSNVYGVNNVGGLVGLNFSGQINRSFARGNVFGEESVGGLVGHNFEFGIIADSFSSGNVTSNLYSTGGLVGVNFMWGEISNCFSTGMLSGPGINGDYFGGLVGFHVDHDYTYNALFWDIESSNMTTSRAGTGLTTAAMMQRNTFEDAGWDFETIWSIDEGISYPYLQAFLSLVPDITGKTYIEALSEIRAAGFLHGQITEIYQYGIEPGYVITQYPEPNQNRTIDQFIDIVLSKAPDPITVPDLIGIQISEAEVIITELGFLFHEVEEAYDEVIPYGHVINQSPESGETAFPADMIVLVISAGPQPVEIPDITGLTVAEAETLLNELNLILGSTEHVYSDVVPEGIITSQEPGTGFISASGSIVNIVVSSGPELFPVPSVIGLTQIQAGILLGSSGFDLGNSEHTYHDEIPESQIISQTPDAGTYFPAGTSIDVVISSGPELVLVPVLIAINQEEAEQRINSSGLLVGTVTFEYNNVIAEGYVISQAPSAGERVVIGSTINFVVSLGKEKVIVPDITGLNLTDAEAVLTNANLIIGSITEIHNDEIPVGLVIHQVPVAGVSVAPETAVDIILSLGSEEEPDTVSVPNVIAMQSESAITVIENSGLVVGTITEEYNDDIPAGQVIRQIPEAGIEVEPGSHIDLVVSLGKQPKSPAMCGTATKSSSNPAGNVVLLFGVLLVLICKCRNREAM